MDAIIPAENTKQQDAQADMKQDVQPNMKQDAQPNMKQDAQPDVHQDAQEDVPLVIPHLVLRKIFQHLSNVELLTFSLVNKQWNNEALSLIKNRGNTIANINKNEKCPDLRAFASDLRQLQEIRKVVPFTGMTISVGGLDWDHGDWCEESSSEEMDQVLEDILGQIRWKYLAVRLSWLWERRKNCPGFQLIKKILHNCCGDLKKFSLLLLEKPEEFTQEALQGCSFPRLKIFEVRDSYAAELGYTNLIKLVISSAPNLQVLYTEGNADRVRNLLEGSAAVHVTNYPHLPFLYENDIPERVVGQLRMQRMCLQYDMDFSDRRPRAFNRITETLFFALTSSQTTLSSLEIGAVFLLPLMHHGLCLENVRSLHLYFSTSNFEISHPRLARILESFDFTRIFPNLGTVCITRDWNFHAESLHRIANSFIGMIDQRNAALMEPMPDRAVNIKDLSLSCLSSVLDSSIRFFVQMFPGIQNLSIWTAQTIPFDCIWNSWPDLEQLDVTLSSVSYEEFHHLESAFCGICPEEIVELQKKDEKYLQSVNIVPAMPSIGCLKGLRTCKLSLDHLINVSVHDPAPAFSKVTSWAAFKRTPDLTVTLTIKEMTVKQVKCKRKTAAKNITHDGNRLAN